MKRTTVYLDELTDLELSRLAKQRGGSKAELIRDALERYIKGQETVRPLPRSVGMGRSGIPDLAERAEEFLGEIYKERYARIMADWEAGEKEPQP